VAAVRCPGCGSSDDKVVDSRQADDGSSIRRRRACIGCGRRFTTFERVEETPLVVVKRSGHREPFDREKVASGIRLAAKGRPIEADGGASLDELIAAIEDAIRLDGGTEVPSAEPCSSACARSTPWRRCASPASTSASTI